MDRTSLSSPRRSQMLNPHLRAMTPKWTNEKQWKNTFSITMSGWADTRSARRWWRNWSGVWYRSRYLMPSVWKTTGRHALERWRCFVIFIHYFVKDNQKYNQKLYWVCEEYINLPVFALNPWFLPQIPCSERLFVYRYKLRIAGKKRSPMLYRYIDTSYVKTIQ